MFATIYVVASVIFYYQICRRSELYVEQDIDLITANPDSNVIELFPEQSAAVRKAA
ncbi:MAG: hypothetical protein JSS72_00230 [Armatimonadetes bacterium]|nr:hypothetical protein [Armatimonadota bacterium]